MVAIAAGGKYAPVHRSIRLLPCNNHAEMRVRALRAKGGRWCMLHGAGQQMRNTRDRGKGPVVGPEQGGESSGLMQIVDARLHSILLLRSAAGVLVLRLRIACRPLVFRLASHLSSASSKLCGRRHK
jgi:hypothetical protein